MAQGEKRWDERERKRMHCIKQMSIYSCIYVCSKENERAPARVYAKERERSFLNKRGTVFIFSGAVLIFSNCLPKWKRSLFLPSRFQSTECA